jgi:two-component system, cell cycle sensor histidine kinase and response regulator CckA
MLLRAMERTTSGDGVAAPTAVKSAEELAAVLRALPDLYFLLDSERRFVDYSAGHGADLYRAPEEFLGRPFDAVLPPDVTAGMIVAIDRAHATNEVVTYDYALELPTGQQWYECRFAPFGASFTVALVRNVTERRLAAEELRLREERLRQAEKLEALGRVAGSIAHDFNNLLTVIAASCSLAERELPAGHAARDQLAPMKAALRSATDLTRHLLSFARREAIGSDVLDVDEVIDGMEFILRGMCGGPIELVRDRSSSPLRVRAVRVQLEQVFLNLIVNAVDAMPKGGKLVIRTVASGEHAWLEVVDTGEGMTAEVVERALEPFFTTKPGEKGSGLGLATVDRVARQSGGHVEIDSATGHGTRVRVVLPLSG